MEKENDKIVCKRTGVVEISSEILSVWHVNITNINLAYTNINSLDVEIKFPDNLIHLNLAHNNFTDVPAIVSKLDKLKILDFSYNAIKVFDETPDFCHSLEWLDLSANQLSWPPCWIWTENPKKLSWVNLSCNPRITVSVESYIEGLLPYKTQVSEINLHYCGLKNAQILETFPHAKSIILGNEDFNYSGANIIRSVPCKGLEKCCHIEKLNLSNTFIHTIRHNIDVFKYLKDLNLSFNTLYEIPSEFCSLQYLETCVLSHNKLLYLPDDMCKLKKLQRLYLDSNELCMIPEMLKHLPNLKTLDLYDNKLYEIVESFSHLEQLDVAQNYLDEPEDVDYLEKKGKLRHLRKHRSDGRKTEPECFQIDYSLDSDEDEEYYRALYNGQLPIEESGKPGNDRSSSPENWDSDSDDHWIPCDIRYTASETETWIQFIKQKMREGNFCPIDAHVVSVTQQVQYHNIVYPQVNFEVIGQFDDYLSDET